MRQTRWKSKHRIGLLAVLFLVLVSGAVFLLRFRHSVTVHSAYDIPSETAVVSFRQDDARWAGEKLGGSKYTMKSSGCLVTSIASALCMGGNSGMTPGILNERLSQIQGYDAEGNLKWDSLRGLDGCSVDVYPSPSSDILMECLAAKRYPIVRVRMFGWGNFHYVLITEARDGTFVCMDPLQDELTELSDYGNRIYAVRCVY